RSDDPAYWHTVFDDPARAAWQKPEELVAALGLKRGQCVADLGAGTGYFSRLLSAAVGPTRTVVALSPHPLPGPRLARQPPPARGHRGRGADRRHVPPHRRPRRVLQPRARDAAAARSCRRRRLAEARAAGRPG